MPNRTTLSSSVTMPAPTIAMRWSCMRAFQRAADDARAIRRSRAPTMPHEQADAACRRRRRQRAPMSTRERRTSIAPGHAELAEPASSRRLVPARKAAITTSSEQASRARNSRSCGAGFGSRAQQRVGLGRVEAPVEDLEVDVHPLPVRRAAARRASAGSRRRSAA